MMARYDGNRSGLLELHEFVTMVMESRNAFKMNIPDTVRAEVLAMVGGQTNAEVTAEVQLRWRQLQGWFSDADTDGSGTLSIAEMVPVIRELYKGTGVSRSERKVNAETAAAMKQFDTDGSGSLNFLEFVTMLTTSSTFKLPISSRVPACHRLTWRYQVVTHRFWIA